MRSCFLGLASSLSFHLKTHTESSLATLAPSLAPCTLGLRCNCQIVITSPPASSQFVFDGLSISKMSRFMRLHLRRKLWVSLQYSNMLTRQSQTCCCGKDL
ncbi:hypothetical protein SLA2020_120730 [Shorea laevis]